MKKLKDVTLNLRAVDQVTITNLFVMAQRLDGEFDLWVTDPGYDLVGEESEATEESDIKIDQDAPHVEAKASVDGGSAVVHFYGLSEYQATLLRQNRLQDFLYTLTEGGTPA